MMTRGLTFLLAVCNPLVAATIWVVTQVLSRTRVKGWWVSAGALGVWLVGAQLGWVQLYTRPYRDLRAAVFGGQATDVAERLQSAAGDWSTWLVGQVPMAVVWGALIAGVILWWRSRYRATWRVDVKRASERNVTKSLAVASAPPEGKPPSTVDDLVLRLGADEDTGDVAMLAANALRMHAVVAGPTGFGKTQSLLKIADELLATPLSAPLKLPYVMIDMKGDADVVRHLAAIAKETGRHLHLVTVDGRGGTYNPLSTGTPGQWKNKLIEAEAGAADGGFTEPHYRRLGERFLLVCCQVLAELVEHGVTVVDVRGTPARRWRAELADVVRLMDLKTLGAMVDKLSPALAARVASYVAEVKDGDAAKDLYGIRTRYALMVEGPAGQVLRDGPNGVNLLEAIHAGDLVVFSLDAFLDQATARQIGSLLLQDLNFTLSLLADEGYAQRGGMVPITIDEFSALGGSQLLALYARARGAGGAITLATQDLDADLAVVGEEFAAAIKTNANVTILHRQKGEAASAWSEAIGTEGGWSETLQVADDRDGLGVTSASSGVGSLRQVDKFKVHPNQFKQLAVGVAYVLVGHPEGSARRVRMARPPRRAVPSEVVSPTVLPRPIAAAAAPVLRPAVPVSAPAAPEPAAGVDELDLYDVYEPPPVEDDDPYEKVR